MREQHMANLIQKLLTLCRTRYATTAFHFRGCTFDDSLLCVDPKVFGTSGSRNLTVLSPGQGLKKTYFQPLVHLPVEGTNLRKNPHDTHDFILKCTTYGNCIYDIFNILDIWASFLFEDFTKFHWVLLVIFNISAYSVRTPYKISMTSRDCW